MKPIFIINGSGRVGKDKFVEFVTELNEQINDKATINYSSIDRVKEIATEIGWQGTKTDKDRKFLSDLKQLCINYNDLPLHCMKEIVDIYNKEDECNVCFLHIRELNEIDKAKNCFNQNIVKTILVKRNQVEPITSNNSDSNVYDYKYDIVIENNGTLDDLKDMAKEFIKNIIIDE